MVCHPGTMPIGEVEADDGVHREHQRRGQSGEQQVGRFVAVPVAGGTAPAHREHAVDDLLPAFVGAVAQGGQIGNQSDEPEQQRDGGVGRDRENVPHQRAAELRPYPHGVGIREQPVGQPRTSDVDQRERFRRRPRRTASSLRRNG